MFAAGRQTWKKPQTGQDATADPDSFSDFGSLIDSGIIGGPSPLQNELAAASPDSGSGASASINSLGQTVYSEDIGPDFAATPAQVRAALNASSVGATGAGITVGVISGSFNSDNYSAADLGYGTVLPQQSAVNILNDSTSANGDDEGRAMMQIVHDIAPGANLDFCTVLGTKQDFTKGIEGSDQAFADAILQLAANGCKVICDDVAQTGVPWFQSGVVDQAIQTVEQEGVTFLAAADNYRAAATNTATTASATYDPAYLSAWRQTSVSLSSYPYTSRTTYTDALEFSDNSPYDAVTLLPGTSVSFQMQWSQPWGGATSNLALVVSAATGVNGTTQIINDGSNNAVYERTDNESPTGESTNLTQDPYVDQGSNNNTITYFQNTGSTNQTIYISVVNLSGPNPSEVEIVADPGSGPNLPGNPPGGISLEGSNAGTSVGHQESPYGMAIAAVDAGNTPAFGNSPPLSEFFSSSDSGNQWLFSSSGTALSSPQVLTPIAVSGVDDINASDFVNGTDYNQNFDDFFGTSAATPSVAGVVALMLQENPNLTEPQIEKILQESATPLVNSSVAGAGLVNAGLALSLVSNPPDDFTGSGTSDVLLQDGGTVVDWIITNGLYSTGNVLTTGATGYTVVGTGDFTGNGTSDVLLQNGGTVVDWIINNGQYQSGNTLTTGATGYTVVGTGDFTGNGTDDILLQNGGTVVDWIINNGQYQSGNTLTTTATGYSVVGTGDFTGNGTDDILLQSGGSVVDWIIKNGQYQSGNVLTTGATGYTVVGTGDFTGNGTSDVLLQNGGTVVDWILQNGQYQSGNVITTTATGFTVVGTGDYTGNGTDDVLLQNGGTVVDWIMKNGQYQSGNTLTTTATGFNVSP